MADYPCDFHLARYKGSSNRVYVNIFREEEEVRLKGSVCSECLTEMVSGWLQRMLHLNPEGVWDPAEDDLELESLFRPVAAPPDRRFLRRAG